MIPFKSKKLSLSYVKLKTVTTALGGSISVVDEKKSKESGKEVLTKVKVPMAVARSFIKQHQISKYLNPVLVALTMYDGYVVAMERYTRTDDVDNEADWIPKSEQTVKAVAHMTQFGKWFTDGTFIYQFNDKASTVLSKDGKFQAVSVDAIKMANICSEVDVQERSCLKFTASNNVIAISPPIWKDMTMIGTRQLDCLEMDLNEDDLAEIEKKKNREYQFDLVDQHLIVNLGFALKAGSQVGDVFGYDAIEPLALDELMIQLRTVNLPKMPVEVKRTFNIGLTFTHALTWLLGLMTKTNENLETYKVIRSLLKYLTTKGVYRSTALEKSAIYCTGKGYEDVPLLTTEAALNNITSNGMMPTYMVNPNKDNGIGVVGPLYGAE